MADKLDVVGIVVITGPLYLPHMEKDKKRYVTYQVIGENDIAVPTHFFKALFYPVQKDPNSLDYFVNTEIYVVPNADLEENISLETFRTSLKNLEKISGIVFPKDKDIMEHLENTPMLPPPR